MSRNTHAHCRNILLPMALACCLLLSAWPTVGLPAPTQPDAGERPAVAAELLLSGKVSCLLRRTVAMPFAGVITALQVQAGTPVTTGQELARFQLTPAAQAEVQRRLFPTEIQDLELALVKLAAKAQELARRQAGLEALARQQLTSPESLEQTVRERRLTSQEQTALQERLAWLRQVHREDLTVLRQQLGQELAPRRPFRQCRLVAPLNGYVLWVHPDARQGAEMKAGESLFQVGVLDPMLIQAQVHELEAMRLQVGDQAEVEVASLPDRRFSATVSRISWSSLTPQPDQPSFFEVEFTVPNPELVLKDGLKVRLRLRPGR